MKYLGNPVAQWCAANGGTGAKRQLCGKGSTSLRWQTVHELVVGKTSPTATTAAKLEANSGGGLDRWKVLRWYADVEAAAVSEGS